MVSATLPARVRTSILCALLVVPLLVLVASSRTLFAASGACTPPSTDYGTSTNTVSISGTGTYRIWSRMSASSSSANTYLLEIDGTSCYTVGGSTVPTYASGATTFFANNSTNWISKTSAGTQMDVNLTAGSHTFKLIGNAAGVVLDRLVLTQDTSCVPTGTGDNCATPPDTTLPTVSISSPANGTTVSNTTTITAAASDDVGVSKVEFYVDGALKATDTGSPYTYSFNPALFTVGSHPVTAKAYDTSGNSATSSPVSINVADTTPPAISSPSAGSITQTTATVTWTTNEGATSQVKYGTSSSYGSSTTVDNTKLTSHSVSLSGLSAGTIYHYQIVTSDAAGNQATSTDATFTTLAPAGDTTAPSLSVTAPSAGTVSGTVTISATASDNVGVSSVQFKYGSTVIATDTNAPYTASWDSSKVANGSYTLTVTASDAAGNTTSKTVAITVNNPTYVGSDINMDGRVNYLDLSVLAANFGKGSGQLNNHRADINGDGICNYLDLSALASRYTLQ